MDRDEQYGLTESTTASGAAPDENAAAVDSCAPAGAEEIESGGTDFAAGADGIDSALLDAEEPLAADEPGLIVFDFNRPHSISKNFEQNLRNLCENQAKMATISFTNLLRANTVLEFQDLSLHPCGDYLANLPHPACIGLVTLAPLKGESLLQLDMNLCFSILKKLMGGVPEPEENLREFTEIERSILLKVLSRLLELFKDASARVVQLQPACLGIENNPDYLTSINTGDTFIILRFQWKLDTQQGDLDFCIPMTGFEPVREQFDPTEKRELRSLQEVQQDRRRIMSLIQRTGSEVVVKLGELQTSMDAIMQLKEGDLITLSQPIKAPVVVEVGQKPIFLAEAGRVDQRRAVRLTKRLTEE